VGAVTFTCIAWKHTNPNKKLEHNGKAEQRSSNLVMLTTFLQQFFPSFGSVCEHYIVTVEDNVPEEVLHLAQFLVRRHKDIWKSLEARPRLPAVFRAPVLDEQWKKVGSFMWKGFGFID